MRPIYTSALLLVASLSVAGAAPPAAAAESYDGCKFEITALPATLTSQGVWCMKGDLSTAIASGAAITIDANNVVLDCNHFKLGGLGAGSATLASGIAATSRVNLVVRNCNVRGFHRGIRGSGVVNATIEDSVFEFNRFTAIEMLGGSGTIVRRNRISETGDSSLSSVTGTAIELAGDLDVVDNLIDGVRGDTGSEATIARGIITGGATGTITGNRLRGLVSRGTGSVQAIVNSSSGRLVMEGNVIAGAAGVNDIGIRCSPNGDGLAIRNRVLGFPASGIVNCVDVDNYVDLD